MKRGEKMEHSIKAGLMITSASDYNMEICRGANEACKELGIELVIFFGGSVDPNVKFVQSSDYQKANVYAFANYLDLDFLVIPASSICRTDQKTREAFPKYFHIPIVTLNSQIKDYPFVVYNNKKAVYDAVSYMIEKNHCQHIGIITGYDSGVTAKQRLAGYQEALSSHDMLFEEKYILSTPGYNIDSGNLMNKWLQENPELDGMMCVTDDIAYYLYRELEKIGKRVGKDIMVSGFDDKPESTHMVPPLASCHADASFIAYLGIKQGYDLYKNGSTQNQYIDAHFIPRLSVDCENHEETEIGEFIRFCRAEKESNEYIAQGMTQYVFGNKLVYSSNYQKTVWSFFTYLLDLSIKDCTKHRVYQQIGDYINLIFNEDDIRYLDLERLFLCLSFLINTENYLNMEDKIKLQSFKQYIYLQMISSYNYLLLLKEKRYTRRMRSIGQVNKGMLFESLNDDIYAIADNIPSLGIHNAQLYLFETPVMTYEFRPFIMPKTMELIINVENGQRQPIKNTHVLLKDVLNLAKQPYKILTSIYSNENFYGFLVTDCTYFDLETLEYLSNQIGISLNVNSIVRELNSISNTDELTHIYNRRGLIQNIKVLYKKYKELSKNLYFFIGDLDNLKYINDTFGHDQGDKAIQTVCEILNDIFQTHAVIGRLGGDEFGIAFTCKNEDFIIQIDSLIQERTQYFNKKYHLPYYVSLSYGISVFDYNSPFDLNHTIRLADTLMYERKKEKHIQRGKKG